MTPVPFGAASIAPAAGGAASAAGGYLPPNFEPSSVTWDSVSTGWVLGPAGTPGHCANANPDICTSVARTSDGGLTWHGLPAPNTGSPAGADGVSGIRFLDGVNGWAFGPELWVTHNAGKTWTSVNTNGQRVTDLETAGDRAYALFARCTASGSGSAAFAGNCTSYTLMTSGKSSDQWSPAGGATNGLTNAGAATSGMIALYGTTGYLAAPDGTLYSGSLGATWQRAGTMPCQPGTPAANGLPGEAQLALASPTTLATFCRGQGSAAPTVYTSTDSGATWATAGNWSGVATPGAPASIAASPSALVVATSTGIYRLAHDTSNHWAAGWSASSATGAQAPPGGFSFVGLTTEQQGVALPADTSRHAVWMTTDGGVNWQSRPIKS
jgi:hypothetical protein